MTIPADVLFTGLGLLTVALLALGFVIGSVFEGCRRGGTLDLINQVCDLEGQLEDAGVPVRTWEVRRAGA